MSFMLPSLNTRLISQPRKLVDRRTEAQSLIHGDIEHVNRYIQQNELQLKTKETEVREAKLQIDHLEAELVKTKGINETLNVKYTEECRARNEITQRTKSIQHMYATLKEYVAKLAERMSSTEALAESAKGQIVVQESMITQLSERLTTIGELAQRRESEYNKKISYLTTVMDDKQSEFSKNLAELNSSLDRSAEECRRQAEQIMDLKKSISMLQNEKEQLLSAIADLEKIGAKVLSDKQQLQEALHSRSELYNDLESSFSSLTQEQQRLLSECDARSVEIKQQSELISKLKECVESRDKELEAACEALKLKVDEMKTAEASWEADLDQQRANLTAQLEEANGKLNEIPVLKGELDEAKNLCAILRSKIEQLSALNEHFRHAVDDTNAELKQIGALAFSFGAKIDSLERDLENAVAERRQLQSHISSQDEQITTQKHEIAGHLVSINEWQGKFETATKTVEELETINVELLSRIVNSEKLAVDLKSQNEQLEKQTLAKDAEIAEKSSSFAALKFENERLSQSLSETKSVMSGSEERFLVEKSQMQTALQQSAQEIQELKKEIEAINALTRQQDYEIQKLRAETIEVDKSRSAMEESFTLQIVALKENLTNEIGRCRGLSAAVKEIEADSAEKQMTLERQFDEERQERAIELEQLQALNSQFQQEKAALEEKFAELKNTVLRLGQQEPTAVSNASQQKDKHRQSSSHGSKSASKAKSSNHKDGTQKRPLESPVTADRPEKPMKHKGDSKHGKSRPSRDHEKLLCVQSQYGKDEGPQKGANNLNVSLPSAKKLMIQPNCVENQEKSAKAVNFDATNGDCSVSAKRARRSDVEKTPGKKQPSKSMDLQQFVVVTKNSVHQPAGVASPYCGQATEQRQISDKTMAQKTAAQSSSAALTAQQRQRPATFGRISLPNPNMLPPANVDDPFSFMDE